MTPFKALLSIAVLLLMFAALGAFFWRSRDTLSHLLSFQSLRGEQARVAVLLLLFLAPLLLTLLGGNVVDALSSRYLLVSWQAMTVILALFLARLFSRSRPLPFLLLVLFALLIVQNNWRVMGAEWQLRGEGYATQRVTALSETLARYGANDGYADYWDASALSFLMGTLTEEEAQIIPYNHMIRFPVEGELPHARGVYTFILRGGQLPEGARPGTLASYLERSGDHASLTLATLPEQVRTHKLVARHEVAGWDLWLLAPAEASR
jgi:hypothetical protein